MFFVYIPTGNSFVGVIDKFREWVSGIFPTLGALLQLATSFDRLDDDDGTAFEECVRRMAKPATVEAGVPFAAARDPVQEEKTRMILVLALNSYTSFLFLAQMAATNTNDRAKISQQIRMAQYLLTKFNDPTKWQELADAIWGS